MRTFGTDGRTDGRTDGASYIGPAIKGAGPKCVYVRECACVCAHVRACVWALEDKQKVEKIGLTQIEPQAPLLVVPIHPFPSWIE